MSKSAAVRVLVTGGCGFIGSWVVRDLLARGAAVTVFDVAPNPTRWSRLIGPASEGVPVFTGELTDQAALERAFAAAQPTHVIHLAALLTPDCQSDPIRGCQVNVLGTMIVFELARRHGVQAISWASSMAVFGPEPGEAANAGVREPNRPPSFYGAFKRAGELVAEQYWMHHRLRSVGLRPHVVYGPEREQGISAGPSLAARAAAHGAEYTIGFRGVLGYDYVEDVARGFVRGALECPAGAHVVDLPSELASVEQILESLEQIVPSSRGRLKVQGPALPSNDSPHDHMISGLFPDWRTTPLAEGLRRTVEFYRT
jgi:nucleoside-diphosphate-sugar epimerase